MLSKPLLFSDELCAIALRNEPEGVYSLVSCFYNNVITKIEPMLTMHHSRTFLHFVEVSHNLRKSSELPLCPSLLELIESIILKH